MEIDEEINCPKILSRLVKITGNSNDRADVAVYEVDIINYKNEEHKYSVYQKCLDGEFHKTTESTWFEILASL